MGLAGVAEAVALLESIRIKDNVKGRAVRTHDPKMGPFTSIEFDGLISNLDQSVADGHDGCQLRRLGVPLDRPRY